MLKQAEERIRKSEAFFSRIFHGSPLSIGITRIEDNTLIEVNEAWETITGFSREEALGHTPLELNLWVNPEDRNRLIGGLHEQTHKQEIECRIHRRDGGVRDLLMSAERIDWAGDFCMLSMAIDISDRKQAEDQVMASLREKEVMLREIHHRVKNNLQIVQSLINLQAGKMKDPLALEAFKESRDRIQSMALVHEKLYQSTHLAGIDISDYLKNLIPRLVNSSQVQSQRVHCTLIIEKEIQVGIDKAIPLGLIVNELISNALKHAFPFLKADDSKEGGRGAIKVTLSKTPDHLLLIVADDGVGFPKDEDFSKSQSLGLQLVLALVEQLKGTIKLHRAKGTEFRIEIPEG